MCMHAISIFMASCAHCLSKGVLRYKELNKGGRLILTFILLAEKNSTSQKTKRQKSYSEEVNVQQIIQLFVTSNNQITLYSLVILFQQIIITKKKNSCTYKIVQSFDCYRSQLCHCLIDRLRCFYLFQNNQITKTISDHTLCGWLQSKLAERVQMQNTKKIEENPIS